MFVISLIILEELTEMRKQMKNMEEKNASYMQQTIDLQEVRRRQHDLSSLVLLFVSSRYSLIFLLHPILSLLLTFRHFFKDLRKANALKTQLENYKKQV